MAYIPLSIHRSHRIAEIMYLLDLPSQVAERLKASTLRSVARYAICFFFLRLAVAT